VITYTTGNTYNSRIVTDGVEIPTANLGFLTMTSLVKYFQEIATMNDSWEWIYPSVHPLHPSILYIAVLVLILTLPVVFCHPNSQSFTDTFEQLVIVENMGFAVVTTTLSVTVLQPADINISGFSDHVAISACRSLSQ